MASFWRGRAYIHTTDHPTHTIHTNPFPEPRESYDSELAAMDPKEREEYLKEFGEAEKDDNWTPKKGSLLDKLIAKGNKKTEDELAAENQLRQEKAAAGGVIR